MTASKSWFTLKAGWTARPPAGRLSRRPRGTMHRMRYWALVSELKDLGDEQAVEVRLHIGQTAQLVSGH
ncbi:MAG: hypothetical protein WD534_07020 [Phycisphaeraceae bacterium]